MNEWEQHLIKVVETCRANNEGMRLGQLLYNAISLYDGKSYVNDPDFESRLYNMYDEEIAKALEEYFEWQSKQT
jgi:predicted double-glycine peptidase